MKNTLALVLIVLGSFQVLADNSNLVINWSTCPDYNSPWCYANYESCDEIVQQLYGDLSWEPLRKNLFLDGIPKCDTEEFPSVWIEKKRAIKKQLFTKCDVPCVIYRFPIKGSQVGRHQGNMLGRQEIFIEHEISTIGNFNYAEVISPWYRHWYAFMYDNRIYYTNKHNVSE